MKAMAMGVGFFVDTKFLRFVKTEKREKDFFKATCK